MGPGTTATIGDQMDAAGLGYASSGAGEPVVLLHAGIADARMGDAQVAAWSSRYRVIRYDAQGFGRSPRTSVPVPRAEDLFRLLGELGVGQAHLVGLSMGGATALDFALVHPERTGALVLVAAGLSGGRRVDRWLEAQNQLAEAAVRRGDVEAAVGVDVQTWLAGPYRRLENLDAGLVERVRRLVRDVVAHDAERTPAPPIDPPAAGRLGEIRAPTLVIVGDADAAPVGETAGRLVAEIPGARQLVLADTAHLVPLERPSDFNAAVLEFLAEHPLAGR